MSSVDPRLLLLSALLLPGCDLLSGDEPESPEREEPPAAEATPDVPPAAEALPPLPLVRAEHRLRFGGKSGERMGFSLAKLSRLHALAGAVEVPEWSQPGSGSTRLTRDDDLRTAWSCDPGPEQACAIGIHFPEGAEVEVVRLYAATPDEGDSSRPKLVRVHTTEGWAEARFSDDDRPWHALLAEPVSTRNLSVEILETHGDGPVHLAELEVLGRSGAPRPPLELDLSRRVITFDDHLWRSKSRTHTAHRAFVEQVDVDGRLERLFPGTAVIGRQGDRVVLVENTAWSTCGDQQGTYDLLDLHTRVVVPLGDFGRFAAPPYRHTAGTGMALGTLGHDDGAVQAIVIEDEHYEHRVSDRLDRRSPKELLESWSIDPTVLSRDDAFDLQSPPTGCTPTTAEDLELLRPQLPKRAKLVAEQWVTCDLDGSRALLSTGGSCGRDWHVAVLDEENTTVALRSGKESGTHLRLRRLGGDALLVELWGSKDEPLLLRVDADGPKVVAERAGFSLRPPEPCRKPCDQGFDDLFAAQQ